MTFVFSAHIKARLQIFFFLPAVYFLLPCFSQASSRHPGSFQVSDSITATVAPDTVQHPHEGHAVCHHVSATGSDPVQHTDSQTTTQTTTCVNSNFNLGTFDFWEGSYGTFANPALYPGFWSIPPNERHLVIPGPGTADPFGFTAAGTETLTTVFPGDPCSARLGNQATGNMAEMLTYNFTVGPSNDLFVYRYAVVLNDNTHGPINSSSFDVDIIDLATGQSYDPDCGTYHVYAQPGLPGWNTSPLLANFAYVRWKNWTTVGMAFPPTAYGKNLKIVFTTKHCNVGGTHFGYAYISAFCSALNTTITGCGNGPVTLEAPPGFAGYEWTGPFCSGCTPSVIGTSQNVTLPDPVNGAEYHLELTSHFNFPNCVVSEIKKTLDLTTIQPAFSADIHCTMNPGIFEDLSVINKNATDLRAWDFGDGTSTITTTPTVGHSYTTPGTYTVTLTRSTTDLCEATATATVTILPYPAITNATMQQSTCSGTPVNIQLAFSQPLVAATWTATVVSGSAAITPDPPDRTGSLINDIIANTGTSSATVVYTITPATATCSGMPQTYTVTIFPVPYTASTVDPVTICSGSGTAIALTPGIPGGTFSWTATIVSGSVTIVNSTPPPGLFINDQIINTGTAAGVVSYQLLPLLGVCTGEPSTCTVTVRPAPGATVSGSVIACQEGPGPLVTFTGLNGEPPYTFIYAIDGGSPVAVTSPPGSATVTIAISTAVAGTQTVTLLGVQEGSIQGCSQTLTVSTTATIYPLPSGDITGTTGVCTGASPPLVTFTGSGSTPPYTFTYNINGGNPLEVVTPPGSSSATIAISTAIPGTYAVNLLRVQDSGPLACFRILSGTAVVSVAPLPTAAISGTATVCQGGTSPTITFTGGSTSPPYTFTYRINGGPLLAITTPPNSATATLAAPSSTPGIFAYELTGVTDGTSLACSQAVSASATVTVKPLPTATVDGSTEVCQNDPVPAVTFTGHSGEPPYTFTYTINGAPPVAITTPPGSSSVSITISSAIAGTYAVSLLAVQEGSLHACSQPQTGSATVTIRPLPSATISGSTAVCRHAAPPAVTFTGSGSTPPYTFGYRINGGSLLSVSTLPGHSSVTVTAPTGTPGTFVYQLLSVQDSGPLACSSLVQGSTTITVADLPTATLTGAVTVCQNSPPPLLTFTGGTTSPPYTFTYRINGGPLLTISSPSTSSSATLAVPTDLPGTFAFQLAGVTDGTSLTCSQAVNATATVTIKPLPGATITGTTAVCQGSAPPLVWFTGSPGTPPYLFTYRINGGATMTVTTQAGNSSVAVPASTSTPGTFVYTLLSVEDASPVPCFNLQPGTVTITVADLPTATLSGTATVCQGGTSPTITFTGGSTSPPYTFTYRINGGPLLVITTPPNSPTAILAAPASTPGTYAYQLTGVTDGTSLACSQAVSATATVTVKPLPIATVDGSTQVCQNGPAPAVTFTGYSGEPPYTFTYTINGAPPVAITTPPGSQSVSITIATAVPGNYTVNLLSVQEGSPQACAQAAGGGALVVVKPWPGPAATPSGPDEVCVKTGPVVYTVQAIANATAYLWSYSGNGITIAGSGNSISATFSPSATSGALTVQGVNECGSGTVSPPFGVTVHDTIMATFAPCFDLRTTQAARKIVLRGGWPAITGQGVYSGQRVNFNALAGRYEFNATGAPPGVYTVTFSYTDIHGCLARAGTVSITVVSAIFNCGDSLTDVRDGKKYPTSFLSGRCWMTRNLDFGTILTAGSIPQADNCLAEKYCMPSDAACTGYGGLYQWDELMDYGKGYGTRGICPPGWHVPSAGEWQELIDQVFPGVVAPHANALSGAWLKDKSKANGFHALLSGILYQNNTWSLSSGTLAGTLFWTSGETGATRAQSRGLNQYSPGVGSYASGKANAFPVRCVID